MGGYFPVTPEITTNHAVENAAIAWVMELERAAGREPVDTRHQGAAADIKSPPRTIEVKAYGGSARGSGLWLESRQVEEAKHNPEFYVYVVENVRQGNRSNFTLRVLGGERLAELIARATERRYYEVPWPVAHYSATQEGLR